MSETIQFTIDLPVSPERAYRAWLDSYEHSQFTGQSATIEARVGGRFESGQARGTISGLTPFDRIIMRLEAAGPVQNGMQSDVEIEFEPTCLGVLLKVVQNSIPAGQADEMLAWWESFYLRPLSRYFEALVGEDAVDIDG